MSYWGTREYFNFVYILSFFKKLTSKRRQEALVPTWVDIKDRRNRLIKIEFKRDRWINFERAMGAILPFKAEIAMARRRNFTILLVFLLSRV